MKRLVHDYGLLAATFGFLALLLVLSSCAGADKGIVTAQLLYNTSVDLAADYAERPRCDAPDAPPLCSDQGVVDRMLAVAENADAALAVAWNTLAAAQGDQGKVDVAVDAALAAAEVLEQLVLEFFVSGGEVSTILIGTDKAQLAIIPGHGFWIDLDGGSRFIEGFGG